MPAPYEAAPFRAEAAGTTYPFADGATLASRDGLVALAPGDFADASLYVPGGDGTLYLAEVAVAAGDAGPTATLTFASAGSAAAAVGTYSPASGPAAITLADPHGRPAGVIALSADPLARARALAWPPGSHPFDPAAAPLAAGCQWPLPEPGLLGLVVDGELFAGDVWVVAGDGVVVRRDGAGVLRVDVVGDPLFARRGCGDGSGAFAVPNFLRTINGNPPDAYGNFALVAAGEGVARPILRIAPAADGSLRIATAARP